jgi:hypothetical protein
MGMVVDIRIITIQKFQHGWIRLKSKVTSHQTTIYVVDIISRHVTHAHSRTLTHTIIYILHIQLIQLIQLIQHSTTFGTSCTYINYYVHDVKVV